MGTEVGTTVTMDMRVAGVHKALVSAGDVTDGSHVSYLEQVRQL